MTKGADSPSTDSGTTDSSALPGAPWCLFPEIDGTLLDSAPAPDSVQADPASLDLPRRLERASDGANALMTGRLIAAVETA
jgi:trehalose 6-phosphate phosphatase